MNLRRIVPALAGILVLAGCESGQGGMGQSPRGSAGLAGLQLGGPSTKAPTPSVGVVLGALLGSEAGKSLDRVDQSFMNQQTNRALESAPTNQASTWQNPDGAAQASVTPTRTYQDSDGTYCRDYVQSIAVGGKQETARGTACRKSDGTWEATG